ncbi:40S ribosomal protein S7-like [Theropithecus gelada]|uniref:40S ribosomal protein S7-like n=1 Tax=Theropithecus gelada TaxID=9565 RepID=UPI000DC18235|nr:40S ribosomal protein S7-like [Theropithecus gelada]
MPSAPEEKSVPPASFSLEFRVALSKKKAMFSRMPGSRSPRARSQTSSKSDISQALLELEVNLDLKAQFRELNITAAKETEDDGGESYHNLCSHCSPEIFPENPSLAST